jgi:bifunctional non-homologous end joining protein LigD
MGDDPESSDYHRPAMTDQLSLRLEPALPNLPANLRPMLARPIPEAFDSAAHLFEPVWGGVRALALVGPAEVAGGGEVTFVGEDGAPIEPVPPDLAGLAARVAARSAVLDGEIVAVDSSGRVDADELARRMAGKAGRPLAYLAFDLLHLDGRSLLTVPLERRRELLRRVLRPGDEVVAVPAIAEEGRALLEAVTAQGLAGIRARQRESPYLPGVRSRLWRSVDVRALGARKRRLVEPTDSLSAPGSDAVGSPGAPSNQRAAPVLALIRRLPLEIVDPAGAPEEPATPPG